MRFLAVLPLLLIFQAAEAAESRKLAAPSRAQTMLGDVGVMANKDDERCNIVLFESKVRHGYRIQVDDGCSSAFPVMGKVSAWRVYTDGDISFVDASGSDLIRFRGKGFKRAPKTSVDGIKFLSSAQEAAE